MNKIMKYMGIAALVLTGALMTSCGTDDDIIENAPQTTDEQPAKKDNTVIVKLTVNRGAQTKALNPAGVKTFAVGDQIFLAYPSTGSATDYAVSAALKEGDITDGGQSATFTFELTNPQDGKVRLTYPASMLNEVGGVEDGVLETQNGTLDNVSGLDLSSCECTMTDTKITVATLENQMAVMEYTLKDASGDNDITSTVTRLTVSDGTNTYTVNRDAGAGPIYVAMYPTQNKDITYTATAGAKSYKKFVSDKTYESGHIYPLGLKMGALVDLSTLTDDYDAKNGDVLTGTLGGNHRIRLSVGATVTIDNVNINSSGTLSGSFPGLYAIQNNTLILKGTNIVRGISGDCPGVFVTAHETLTIEGDGSLTATGDGEAAGIGAQKQGDCGNIIINGGTITANGGPNGGAGIGAGTGSSCGYITINGGTITATGSYGAAGIGSAYTPTGDETPSACGNITIANTVTRVTATKGTNAAHSIGIGYNGSTCGTITIGGTVYADGITTSPYTYQPSYGHALSASVVGDVVGTDGLAYAVSDKDNLPTGVTAAAVVAYKNGDNGLAIALTDEASAMNRSTAYGNNGAAAHTPTVSGQTWTLPHMNQWKQMFSANGGSETSYTGLNTKITNAGGTALIKDNYWTSYHYNTGGLIPIDCYVYMTLDGGDASFDNIETNDTNSHFVRACLSF